MFSWFDLCWQEIPKTSQIPKTFSKHLRTSRQVRLSKMLTLQRCWHHSATSGAISQSMCGRSSMSMNLWALQPNYIVDKIWLKNHRKFLALYTFSYPLLKQLRSGNPTVWETQALLLGFCLDLPRSFKDQEVGLAAHEPARLCLGTCGWVQQVGPKGLHGAIKFCFVSLIYYVIL